MKAQSVGKSVGNHLFTMLDRSMRFKHSYIKMKSKSCYLFTFNHEKFRDFNSV